MFALDMFPFITGTYQHMNHYFELAALATGASAIPGSKNELVDRITVEAVGG